MSVALPLGGPTMTGLLCWMSPSFQSRPLPRMKSISPALSLLTSPRSEASVEALAVVKLIRVKVAPV